jgi:hypothetical protein
MLSMHTSPDTLIKLLTPYEVLHSQTLSLNSAYLRRFSVKAKAHTKQKKEPYIKNKKGSLSNFTQP